MLPDAGHSDAAQTSENLERGESNSVPRYVMTCEGDQRGKRGTWSEPRALRPSASKRGHEAPPPDGSTLFVDGEDEHSSASTDPNPALSGSREQVAVSGLTERRILVRGESAVRTRGPDVSCDVDGLAPARCNAGSNGLSRTGIRLLIDAICVRSIGFPAILRLGLASNRPLLSRMTVRTRDNLLEGQGAVKQQ
jgi:hypothetical protein